MTEASNENTNSITRSISCSVHYPVALMCSFPQEICSVPDDRKDGLTVGFSMIFNAAWQKNSFLASALSVIEPHPAILCDADVWLSAELIERINAIMEACPATGVLYGLAGRRVCRILPGNGLPTSRLGRHATIIGYCQFTREHNVKPWLTKSRGWGEDGHDDWKVYAAFGPEHSVALPFACYHLGGVSRHWGGFQGRLMENSQPEGEGSDSPNLLGRLFGETGALRICLIGESDARGLAGWIADERRILVLEPWALNQFPIKQVEDLPVRLTGIAGWLPGKWEECRRRMLRGEPALPLAECVNPLFLRLIEADRKFTRKRFLQAVEDLKEEGKGVMNQASEEGCSGGGRRVRILGEGGVDPLSEVDEGGVDVVWLGGEIGYTPLLQDVPKWRRKFPAAVVRASLPVRPAGFQPGAEGKISDEANQQIRNVESCGPHSLEDCATWESYAPGPTGLVCGAFHDIWAWPESTACVEMLLGTPEVVTEDGQWLRRVGRFQNSVFSEKDCCGAVRYPLAIPLVEEERVVPASREYGIVFYQNDRGEGTVEDLMLSLHSLRKHWRGEIAVLFSGEESPSVRIACARYDTLYREVPEPEVQGDPRVVERVFADPAEQVREWGSYQRVLWVESGLIGREREFEKWAKRMASLRAGKVGSASALPHQESDAAKELTEAASRRMPPPERVERLRREPAQELRQRESRAALEVEVMLAWAASARVRREATVVVGLLPEDLPGFEKNWTATKWRHAALTLDEEPWIHRPVPVLLGLCGVEEEDARNAMRHRTGRLPEAAIPDLTDRNGKPVTKPGPTDSCCTVDFVSVPMEEDEEAEPHWTRVLAAAAGRADTEWLIYLDPMMHPSPGAELFLPHRLPGHGRREQEVYAPGWAFRRIGSVERDWVERIFAATGAEKPEIPGNLEKNRILKHLRLGPSATMIRRSLMREAFEEWEGEFRDIPFEIFLTLRLRRDLPPDPDPPPPQTQPAAEGSGKEPVVTSLSSPAGMGVCRPQDWGWNT